jgi:hypothetical protein
MTTADIGQSDHVGFFNEAVSIGILRRRVPVAA